MATPSQLQVTGFREVAAAVKTLIGPAAELSAGPIELPPALATAVSVLMVADIKGHFQSGTAPDGTPWPPIKARARGGDKPLLDTGTLRAGIWGRPESDGATAGTHDKRANLLHFGGTVTPKNAKFLAIPLTRDAVRAGSPRNFPRKLTVIRTKRGGLILAETPERTKAGKAKKRKKQTSGEKTLGAAFAAEGDLIPQYALLKSVTVPARPFVGISGKGQARAGRMVANWATGKDLEATS